MYLVGTMLLVASLGLALQAIISYILVIRGNRAALGYGRGGVYGAAATVGIVWALLVALFLMRRFDIAYVTNYSSRDLSTFFTIAASWSGQPGSFALWAAIGGIIAGLLVGRTRHFEPYVLVVLMSIQVAFIAFMLTLNPFTPLTDPQSGTLLTPADGNGLNPLLHNFWMIIHPPVLFVGFALAAVPFAFALGGLLRYDYDTWVTRALPWTLAAWAFLGMALLLGGYWAYETLGWGGYWGWDPVENSSLVPWLTMTALLHGMVMQRSQGSLRRTNMVLVIITYIAVIYSTFLTRSGVLTNFSVHSFVAEGIKVPLFIFMGLLGVSSLSILIMRWRDIPSRPLSDRFFSRESFFALAILTLMLIAGVVTIGTSMPLISAIPGIGPSLQQAFGTAFEIDDGSAMGGAPFEDGRFSLAPSFYDKTTPPLGLIVVALMIIGPLLGWRDVNMRHMLRALRLPAVAAVVVACMALLLGVRDPLPLAYVTLGTFAIGSNLVIIVRTLRSGWLRIGGYLAHVGLCVMLIGIVGSSAYASPDEKVMLQAGETVSIYDHAFTFNGWKRTPDGKGVIDLTVQHNGNTFAAQPQLYYNEQTRSYMQTPAIKNYLLRDIYVAPADYVPEEDPNQPFIMMGDTVEMGPYEITFQEFAVDTEAMLEESEKMPDLGATLLVRYEGETTEIKPAIQPEMDEATQETTFADLPATLPGGHSVSLAWFNLDQRIIRLKTEGLDLPVQPERTVITVGTKPAVALVWLGVIVTIVGGLVAFLRRSFEGEAWLTGQRLRLPKGLAWRWRAGK